jgi:hypothetical protein
VYHTFGGMFLGTPARGVNEILFPITFLLMGL